MKKLLFLAMLTVPLAGISQKRDTTLFKAGNELIKYDKQYTTGVMLQLGGGILMAAGTLSNTSSSNKPLLIGGGLIAFFGFVTQLSSSSHIKKAGILLRNNKLVIPL